MGNTARRNPKHGYQDGLDLVQVDWNGNVVWKFNRYELVKDPRQKARWTARQHHDFQREGTPSATTCPGWSPGSMGGIR